MALVVAILQNAIRDAIVSKGDTLADGCDLMASAYNDYAATATAGVATGVFTGLEETQFSNALLAALGTPSTGSPAGGAAAFVAAVTAFWMAPPVVFGAGVVTAFAGAPALLAALTAMFAASNDADAAASALATALDVATKTVTVVIGPTTFTLT